MLFGQCVSIYKDEELFKIQINLNPSNNNLKCMIKRSYIG